MARARNIKPGFFKNEDLAECTAWARLCFAGLWTLADREGRLEDRAKRIKGELFAFDTVDVEPLLAELEGRGFLVRYRNSDGSFIQISKFSMHQTPHYSEKQSVIKPPELQEKTAHQEPSTPGTLQEDSRKTVPIKRGSQPSDSLIPDSPNPSSPNPDSPKEESSPPGKARKRATPSEPPERPVDVSEQVWNDWLTLRRQKRAPVTPTVLVNAKAEAAKASMTLELFLVTWCGRGSQGLEAAWLRPDERRDRGAATQAANAVADLGAKRLLFGEKIHA